MEGEEGHLPLKKSRKYEGQIQGEGVVRAWLPT